MRSEGMKQTRFASAADLEATLTKYGQIDNSQTQRRSLHHLTHLQTLKDWPGKRLELLAKRVKSFPGLGP